MQREILFRGKRVEDGKWVEGLLVDVGAPHSIIKNHMENHVHTETVGHFVGFLSDGNTKVFEGDFVTFNRGYVDDSDTDYYQGAPLLIEYDSDNNKYVAVKGSQKFSLSFSGSWKWTLIGNIYDNPEMLKK